MTLAGVLFALVAATAVAGAQGNHIRDRDPAWVAPPASAAKANPLAGRSDAEAGGAKIFNERCTTCHGDDARGTDRGPDLLAGNVQAQSDGALFWKIGSGNTRAGMPAFSFLPELQRWQLVLHLRALAKQPGTELAGHSSDGRASVEIPGYRRTAPRDFPRGGENFPTATRTGRSLR